MTPTRAAASGSSTTGSSKGNALVTGSVELGDRTGLARRHHRSGAGLRRRHRRHRAGRGGQGRGAAAERVARRSGSRSCPAGTWACSPAVPPAARPGRCSTSGSSSGRRRRSRRRRGRPRRRPPRRRPPGRRRPPRRRDRPKKAATKKAATKKAAPRRRGDQEDARRRPRRPPPPTRSAPTRPPLRLRRLPRARAAYLIRTSPTASLPPMPATERLPRGVRVGYGSGSVATGAFGTVPGLMLLPYLTDSLGIAALRGGVHRVRAEGVGRGAEPGRGADQRPDRGPARSAAAVAAARRDRARGRVRAAVRGARDGHRPRGAVGAGAVPGLRDGVRLLPGAVRRDAGRAHLVLRRAHPADDLAGRDPRVHHHARRRVARRPSATRSAAATATG